MTKLFTAAFLLIFLLVGFAYSQDILQVDNSKYLNKPGFIGYKTDEFIIILKDNVGIDHAMDMANDVALNHLDGFQGLSQKFKVKKLRPQFIGADKKTNARILARHYKVRISEGTIDDAVEAYSKLPFVERVEKIGIHTVHAVANDTYYDDPPPEFPYDQWHYWDTYGVEADVAWDMEAGDQSVLVGDLDIGAKYDHGDLGGSNPPGPDDASTNGNIWVNTNEIPGNSIDDDGNGYVDDVIGWDFVERTNWYAYPCTDLDCGGADNDPWDGDGHGTHTAGTIAAITNNGYAVAGVAGGFGDGTYAGGGNGIKIVPCRIGYLLRYLNQDVGVVIMDYVAEAMYYMAELKTSGWNVAAINCSFGTTNSGGLAAACDYLQAQDVVVVVSAGNSGSSSQDYLASRGDCIDVGATDQSGDPASFSNYGSWVDIAAPGVMIMSTITDPTDPSGDYIAPMDGTSMACPHVAGVVALIESYNPSLSAIDKINIITDPANTKPYNMTRDLGPGIVDAKKCLDAAGGGCDLTADFSGTPTSGCAPLSVSFSDLSTGTGIDGWFWMFGDGGSSTAQNPNYTYNSPGTYNVTLTVSSSSQGCDDIVTKNGYITVYDGPTADFSGSPTTGVEPLTVDFTDASTDATGWSWDFGDGVGTSTAQNPSYTYTSVGTYTVKLTASNACGSDVNTKTDYITVNPCVAPVADFSGAPTSGVAPLTVDFTDLSTNAATWSWTFGDGGGSTSQNPSYTYTAAGTYTVTLTASNACGSDLVTKIDYITVTEPQVGNIYANADISILGTYNGTFANTTASDDSYQVITESESTNHPRKVTSNAEHKWTFNLGSGGSNMMFYLEAYRNDNTDGDDFIFAYSTDDATYNNMITVASATEQVYSFAPPVGLTGTVYVRVVDDNRSWDLISLDNVYIDEMYFSFETGPVLPVADFVGSPTSGAVPLMVNFTDISTGAPDTWNWDFGDEVGTSTAQNPSYTYNSVGTYTVSLTVTNAQGSDTETKTNYITVSEVGGAMHVESMAVGRSKVGPNYVGTCTVTIFDNLSNPVADATVYVTATGPTGGSFNGTTAADGTVDFQTSGFKKPSGEWCFEVTNVTHASLTYDSDANIVTYACESGPVYKSLNSVSQAIPNEFNLSQNIPNPFNPSTEIGFSLPVASYVTLDIYNLIGQKVAVLADGVFEAGQHSVIWNTSNQASGIYFYRLTAGQFAAQKKMVLLK